MLSITQDQIKFAAYILVLAGAINWLGVGIKGVDYVAGLTGDYAKFIFIAVGVAGLYLAAVTALDIKKKLESGESIA